MAILAGCASAPMSSTDPKDLHVVAQLPVGGVGGWDLAAFDTAHRRLFVSHSDRVEVIDVDAGKVVGQITGMRGVHAIAVAPEANRGFITNGAANTVTVFGLDKLDTIREIKVTGENPDAILYDSHSEQVFVFNGRSANVTVINARTLQVVNTIALPGKPELAVSDGSGRVFVNIEDKNQVVMIDAASGALKATWSLFPGEEPSGLAIDAEHRRLFAVCSNHKMIVLDAGSGRVVQEVAIGEGPDSAAFDRETGLVYSSNGEGNLTVVHEDDPDHFSVVATVPTKKSARTLALDPAKHRVYLPAADLGPAPEATPAHPHPRPSIIPDTFSVLVVGE